MLKNILGMLPIRLFDSNGSTDELDDSDESHKTKLDLTRYFSNNYLGARTKFINIVKEKNGHLHSIRLDGVVGSEKEELYIDVARFGPVDGENILLHISGVNGVDGYTGSAIQCKIIDDNVWDDPKCTVVFIHALNPYGMSMFSTWNESNVDLNKNFRDTFEEYCPPIYEEIDEILNPKEESRFWKLKFYTKSFLAKLRYDWDELIDSITTGQNKYPQGIFNYGTKLEQGPSKLLFHLRTHYDNAKNIILIDVHTGSDNNDNYGNDTLLSRIRTTKETKDEIKDKELCKKIISSFGNHEFQNIEEIEDVISDKGNIIKSSYLNISVGDMIRNYMQSVTPITPDKNDTVVTPIRQSLEKEGANETIQKVTNVTKGSVYDGVCHSFPDTNCYGIRQDFGTFPEKHILCALHIDNYYTQHQHVDINHTSKKKLLRAFYPLDQHWKNNVLIRGVSAFYQGVEFLQNL